MGVADPVILKFDPGYATPWYLTRGGETFYDEERFMRMWPTAQAAADWAREELGVNLETVVRAYLLVEQHLERIRPFGGPRVAKAVRQRDAFLDWLVTRLFGEEIVANEDRENT